MPSEGAITSVTPTIRYQLECINAGSYVGGACNISSSLGVASSGEVGGPLGGQLRTTCADFIGY